MENGSNGNGGSSIGGDSDSSLPDSRVCRDFMRNVCQRGKNCRFVHPDNIKIRTEPIFCHDFQQGRCFRSNCKFIHCNREEEEHFKVTGELPDGVHDPEGRVTKKAVRSKTRAPSNGTRNGNGNGNNNCNGNADISEVPLCKDFLKGVCERPPGGCKFRHVAAQRQSQSVPVSNYGRPCPTRGRGSSMTLVTVPSRRRVRGDVYDEGPETKRYQLDPYSGYEEEYEIDDGEPYGTHGLPPPPPPRGLTNQGYYATYPTSQYTTVSLTRNGYQPDGMPYYHNTSHSDTQMKALEDENFMLKRRIEELKNSNEFLLNQNAQLRLNNSLSTTSVAQVQPLAVSAVSVSSNIPSAQPSIIGITSSSLTGTQPLPTISISTLPTVSTIPANSIPVSISQTLQTPSLQSQPQIYIPAPTN